MDETGVELGERRWVKDTKEVIAQVKYAGYVDVAKSVVGEAGYSEKARVKLQELAKFAPEKYAPFASSLREAIGENEVEVKSSFEIFLSSHPETPETNERKKSLEKKVVKNGEPTPEQTEVIKKLFPSGNYLEHSSSVRGALAIAGDPDSAIKSPEEIRKTNPNFRGQGGVWGISFGMNGVDAMPGTWRHIAIFVTSPEEAMSGGNKLIVPYRGNPKEQQVVGLSYDRELAVYAEATYDFIEKRNSLDEDGVKDDFLELEHPIVYKTGESPIERDLDKLKKGEIGTEDISSKYKVVDGKLIVNPEINEQDISLGLIYADFLLKYTPEGRELKKNLEEATVGELLEIYKSTASKIEEIEDEIARISEALRDSMSVSLGIEKTVMFVPEADVNLWLDVFSRVEKSPLAFVTFVPEVGPKIPNWNFPEGHKEKAEDVINSVFQKSGIPVPSLKYSDVLGRDVMEDDVIKENVGTGYLRWKTIEHANELVLDGGKLKIRSTQGALVPA